MQIHEVIRGLSLAGAETLLTQRLEERHSSGPTGERRSVLNCVPALDFYADRVAAVADYTTKSSGSVARGIVETFRDARRHGSDTVVVVHSPAAAVGYKLYAALAGRRRRFTLVEVVHNTQYRRVYIALGRVLNRFADCCICVSTEVATAPTAVGYRARTVVLGGVDTARMRAWAADRPDAWRALRADLGVTTDQRLLVNVGNLYPRKNQQLLVRALAELGADVHLVVIGEGPERPALEALIDELGVEGRVHLLGSQPDAWQWIAAADLVTHPSAHEGLPVVVMETLALGVPLLATEFGGLQDLRDHGAALDLTHASSPSVLAADIERVLAVVPPVHETWSVRMAGETYWDMGRYTDEFYSVVLAGR